MKEKATRVWGSRSAGPQPLGLTGPRTCGIMQCRPPHESQIVNFPTETVIALARLKAERAAQFVRFQARHDGFPPLITFEEHDLPAPRTLEWILNEGWDYWTVWPSGLALPAPLINWFWVSDVGSVRLGTATQAGRYYRDRASVYAVDPPSVHGTCVWDGDRMIQARAFPAWTGV